MSRPRPKSKTNQLVVPVERLERRIYLIRDQKVMIDSDLSELHAVPTKVFNQAVKRNRDRFPDDFMFQLTKHETDFLRSQNVTSKEGRGGRRYLSYAFTEQGVAMLSSVLNSERAVQVNIVIMRAFVQLRQLMLSNEELNRKISTLEKRYDENFKTVFGALRRLLTTPEKPRRRIGFKSNQKSW